MLLWWLGLVLLGLGVGLIAGMFGVGGGFLMTPMLAVVFRVPLDIAVGTGLCQMIGVAVAALRRHLRLGQSEIKIDWILMAGSLLGVGLGARTVSVLTALATLHIAGHSIAAAQLGLSLSYIGLLALVAFWMGKDAHRPMRPLNQPVPPGPLTRLRIPPMTPLPCCGQRISATALAYLGLVTGFLSGLLGIGGGVLLMPILIYGIGMRTRVAAGTGILVLLASALVGTAVHAAEGHVDLRMAMVLLVGATLGAQVGAMLTAQIDGQKLRRIFVWLVLFTACAVAWNLFRVFFAS